ncbi:endoglucanase-4 [Ilyonectria robusta]
MGGGELWPTRRSDALARRLNSIYKSKLVFPQPSSSSLSTLVLAYQSLLLVLSFIFTFFLLAVPTIHSLNPLEVEYPSELRFIQSFTKHHQKPNKHNPSIIMRYSAVSALAMVSTVAAHAQVYGVWVNDVDQGDGRSAYIRSPPNNSPVKDLTSADLACNVNGGTAVSDFVTAAAGDKLTVEWYHDNRADDIIASSHKGPVITYIAPYTAGDGTGAIWTKIAEDGYDGSEWAVDKLIAAKGKADFTLPSSLAAGQYLIRQEIIAHHESDTAYSQNSARGAQFYPSCIQFEITGSGSDVPDQNFDFNTGYTDADPGIVFNLYGSYTSYDIPGPEVWTGSGSSGDLKQNKTCSSVTRQSNPLNTCIMYRVKQRQTDLERRPLTTQKPLRTIPSRRV